MAVVFALLPDATTFPTPVVALSEFVDVVVTTHVPA